MTADPVSFPSDSPTAGQNRDAVYVAGNVLGVLSIAFGGIATLLGLVPVIGLIAMIFAFVGGLWGVIGLIVLLVGKRGSVKLPVIGLALNVVAFFLCIVVSVIAALVLSNA